MKTIRNFKPTTRLEKRVKKIIKSYLNDNYTEEDFFKDMSHGCSSGFISELIYYSDTTRFFRLYKSDIKELLKEMLDDTGLSIDELFGKNFDADDIFCEEQDNQNLLAWFGFEEVCNRIASKLED